MRPLPVNCYSPPTLTDRVISRQGWRTLPGESERWHNGQDYAGAEGDPILAVRPGIVEAWYAAGTPGVRGYGVVVVLRHAADVLTAYAHCLDVRHDVGAFVQAGEQIGRIGQTSGRGGDPTTRTRVPHLHFEIVRRWPLRADDTAARYDIAATLAAWRAECAAGSPTTAPPVPGAIPVRPPTPPRADAPGAQAGGDRREAGDPLPWLAALVIIGRRRRRT